MNKLSVKIRCSNEKLHQQNTTYSETLKPITSARSIVFLSMNSLTGWTKVSEIFFGEFLAYDSHKNPPKTTPRHLFTLLKDTSDCAFYSSQENRRFVMTAAEIQCQNSFVIRVEFLVIMK